MSTCATIPVAGYLRRIALDFLDRHQCQHPWANLDTGLVETGSPSVRRDGVDLGA